MYALLLSTHFLDIGYVDGASIRIYYRNVYVFKLLVFVLLSSLELFKPHAQNGFSFIEINRRDSAKIFLHNHVDLQSRVLYAPPLKVPPI